MNADNLPVGNVLNEAFQFGVHRLGTVIRYGWAPMLASLMVMVAGFLLVFNVETIDALQGSGETVGLSEILRMPVAAASLVGVIVFLIFLYFFSGFMTSIFRLVALGEDRPGIFHVRTDGPATRTFWAYIIYTLINYAILAAMFFVALAVTNQSLGDVFSNMRGLFEVAMASAENGAEPDPATLEPMLGSLGAIFLALFFALIPMMYVNTKLAPFLAGSASENRILLFGSFAMTKGNFWSILGVYFLLGLMLIVASVVFQLGAGILDLIGQFLSGQGGAIAIIGIVISLIVLVASLLFQAFMYGVQFSSQAIIYRRLKTGS